MRWKAIVVVLLLAALAPDIFIDVARTIVDAALAAINKLVGEGRG